MCGVADRRLYANSFNSIWIPGGKGKVDLAYELVLDMDKIHIGAGVDVTDCTLLLKTMKSWKVLEQ